MDYATRFRQAYKVAMREERPIVRVCADVELDPPLLQEKREEISGKAGMHMADGYIFMIGCFADELKPAAECALRQRVRFSHLRVDGLAPNGDVNVAVWFQRTDMEHNSEESLCTVLKYPAVDVLVRPETTEGLPYEMSMLTTHFGFHTPPFGRVVYSAGHRNSRDLYLSLPVPVLGWYGGSLVPAEYARFTRDVEKAVSGTSL